MGYHHSLLLFASEWYGSEVTILKAPFPGLKCQLPEDYCVAVFPPGSRHDFWVYLTVGLSHGLEDKSQVELFLYSPRQEDRLVRALTAASCYHRFNTSLGLHHTINLGLPWLEDSACTHGYIQQPYLDGPELELFDSEHGHAHLLWLIPITQLEKNFAVENGWEALEERFEEREFNYLDPRRPSVVP